MRRIPVVLFFMVITIAAAAQSPQPQKAVDSVCVLVKKYMNEKSTEKLYQLTGPGFKKAINPEAFRNVTENNLFRLGEMKETTFEKSTNGVSIYKATFASVTLSLIVSLDSTGKLMAFGFRPYKDENAKKDYAVPSSNPLLTAVDSAVDKTAGHYISQLNTVGLSVGVIKDGQHYFYGYGETAKGNKALPGPATVFEIGSITKTFTATLLAIAVGEGKVRLDDPVNKYLPDSISLLSFNKRVVTLRDLSNHTSAIPRMPSNFQSTVIDPLKPFNNYSVENLYSFLRHLTLTREPGTLYEYSNAAVGLLGVILQKIFNRSYEQLIVKYICDPLNMQDTRVSVRDPSLFAKGYLTNGGYSPPWDLPASMAGAGAIRSTARDMLKYAEANMGGGNGGESAGTTRGPAGVGGGSLGKAIRLTHDTTFSDAQVKIGLGWHFLSIGDRRVLFHNGATGGYRAFIAIDPGKKIAVVLLSNSAVDPDEEGTALMRSLLNL